ncbi:DUF4190 domain-containing protein [Streptomyces sp. NPDC003401]
MSDDVPGGPAGDPSHDPWAAPGSVPEGTEGPQYAHVPLDEPDGGSASADPDPWPAPAPAADHGSGVTIAAGEVPLPRDLVPPSVHDQRTVTSLPGVTPTPPVGTSGGDAPFASFPPPRPGTASPVASPGPFAPPADGAVPPPPISPDGPGQVPYGYPGGYGHPGPHGYGATPSHGAAPTYGGAPGHYGWPGMPPAPSNGMGITAMVLGIVAAVGFCLWPVAIVVGVLALIFGLIGRSKADRGEATNPGQALAGIICGAVGLALGVGLAVLLIVAP